MKSYLECPWLYKILYVDLKRRAPTAPSSLGQSIHRTLEAYHREDADSLERLLEFYDEYWVHAGFASAQDQMIYYARGKKMLERYWELDQSRKSKIVFVEKEFEFPLGPHTVRGIMDRVDLSPEGKYHVIDYKTQQEILEEKDLSQNLQLGLYGMALREALGFVPGILSLFFLAHGKVVSIAYDPSREKRVRGILLDVGARISRREFKPDPRHCPRCDFRKTCQYSTAKD
ncbi:MAG: PD-(D/E)XK nuclease family protein [Elusimicrobia bacterium]|nr:PD-(D/E)XK nuclease family protein [Elusimicrobiota bacterium]